MSDPSRRNEIVKEVMVALWRARHGEEPSLQGLVEDADQGDEDAQLLRYEAEAVADRLWVAGYIAGGPESGE